jgi:flagellar assembly protein FliH
MHERAQAEKNLGQEIERASREVAQVLRNFEVERVQHLRKVEAECAGLALAIACKILQREAETDPLLMQAAVRIALERVDAASEIRLRVPLKHADSWTASLAGTRIAVIADVSLPTEGLVLETEIGTAELGWTAQIKEIEREFLETLNARPGTLQ